LKRPTSRTPTGRHPPRNGRRDRVYHSLSFQISGSRRPSSPTSAKSATVCVDKKRQWSKAKNVRHSVAIRSTLHMMKPGKSR